MIEVSFSCTALRLWNAIKMFMRKRNAFIYLLGLQVLFLPELDNLRPYCMYASKCSDETAQDHYSHFFYKLAQLISQY